MAAPSTTLYPPLKGSIMSYAGKLSDLNADYTDATKAFSAVTTAMSAFWKSYSDELIEVLGYSSFSVETVNYRPIGVEAYSHQVVTEVALDVGSTATEISWYNPETQESGTLKFPGLLEPSVLARKITDIFNRKAQVTR